MLGDVGLLAIYPISKDSQPRNRRGGGRQRRLPLGRGRARDRGRIVLPRRERDGQEYTYMSADLSGIEREPDDVDIDDIDAADERSAELTGDSGA